MSPQPKTVSFQGNPGAYGHLACRAHLPHHQVVPVGSFDQAFDVVEDGTVDLAMIPIENSRAGRVVDIHRLLPERPLHIVGEHYQPVHHQLLAPHGAQLHQLRRVRSHPQALRQCREFLTTHGLTAEATSDTAGAAAEVAELGDPTVGAIASPLAGSIYGLDILAADIHDDQHNTTRFVVLARDAQHPANGPTAVVTSCLFQVRNVPAALYKALGGFATNGVNLLKLESYQRHGFHWTQFAIDIQGHVDSRPVTLALQELSFFSESVRVLGCYPASPDRPGVTRPS